MVRRLSETQARALDELARRVDPGQARRARATEASPCRERRLVAPRADRRIRRGLHELVRRWQREPTVMNPLWARACWAAAALDAPIDDDECENLRRARDQRFRDCAEQAGVMLRVSTAADQQRDRRKGSPQ